MIDKVRGTMSILQDLADLSRDTITERGGGTAKRTTHFVRQHAINT